MEKKQGKAKAKYCVRKRRLKRQQNGEGTSTKEPKAPKSKGKNGKKDNGPTEIGQGSQAPPATQD
ncbi:hypothetical protein L195_g056464 [Trifolium pratense]|uniref:Uncharacterized protein n=1 Tax=Trifolium pratense TaxID=57577 RepID=A0A2K3KRS0_TRIPR|nr:hypothetical protein L195_g056464 [Trifolium pratense]